MMRPLAVGFVVLAVSALASHAESGGRELAGGAWSAADSGVRVFRGGRAEMGQGCQPVSGAHGVVVYSGCARAPENELDGGLSAARETITVTAEKPGYCATDIRRADAANSSVYSVCYSDLQPVYGGRIDDLYRRITRAAERACARSAGYGAARRHAGCEAQAIDLAVYDTALPALIDYHIQEIGRRSPVFVGSRR